MKTKMNSPMAAVFRLATSIAFLGGTTLLFAGNGPGSTASGTNAPPSNSPANGVPVGRARGLTNNAPFFEQKAVALAPMTPVDVGGNYRTWGSRSGRRIVAIGTGMNYWNGQQWSPSDPSFVNTGDAFVAGKVQHKVSLAANLNAIGSVNLTTPDGIVLRSTPVAIGLYDAASGQATIIATLTNCSGSLVSSNEVIYQNAFAGSGVCADIVYRLERGSFQQDVVITGRLDPRDYGFPTNTTRIQIITEFYGAPAPDQITHPIRVEKNPAIRSRMATPDLVDQLLGFGELVLGAGRALTTASLTNSPGAGAPVVKEFKAIAGRTFLVESVEYGAIRNELQSLPQCSVKTASLPGKASGAGLAFAAIPNPPSAVHAAAVRQNDRQVAKATMTRPRGVVIDYFATIGGSLYGTTVFQGDTTYFVSAPVYCNGPTTIEGGAVFKYPNSTGSNPTVSFIQLNNTVTCTTSSYRPAIFTAADDDSVGESLADQWYNDGGTIRWYSDIWPNYTGWNYGYDGSYYANPALDVYYVNNSILSNLRFSYAQEAVRFECYPYTGYVEAVAHCQLADCLRGITVVGLGSGIGTPGPGTGPTSFTVKNTLWARVPYPLTASSDSSWTLYHCTVDQSTCLASSTTPSASFSFVNSVFANVTSLSSGGATVAGNYNGFYPSSNPLFGAHQFVSAASPFLTVNSGGHYLADASGFRDVGTTYLPTDLVAALKTKTTHPPLSLPAGLAVSGQLDLYPQAARYASGPPDLGYYYDALDYTVAEVYIANGGQVLVHPGTATAVRTDSYSGGYPTRGFVVFDGSSFQSYGSPTTPNTFAALPQVQEGPFLYSNVGAAAPNAWRVAFVPYFLVNGYNAPPVLSFRFSNFYLVGPDYHVWSGMLENGLGLSYAPLGASYDSCVSWALQDCNVWGGGINIGPPVGPYENLTFPSGSISWTNNLFERVDINLDPTEYPYGGTENFDLAVTGYNNLLRHGRLRLEPDSLGDWLLKDNLFDKVPFQQQNDLNVSMPLVHDCNGFWPCQASELAPGQTPYLPPEGSTAAPHDVVLTAAPTYVAGTFGSYYLQSSSPLLNAGSRTPADAGLWHYTAVSGGSEEGSQTQVNIGRQYLVAVGANPKDSDGDGIPDYIEDANGNGTVDSRETSPYLQYTDGVTFDPYSTVYDDIDLSGSGLVGRVKRALSIAPLSPSNPLTLTQVVTGDEPQILTFEMPISYSLLTSVGGLNLNINGIDATLEECGPASDGNSLLVWNTTYDPPSQHCLQPQFLLAGSDSDTATVSALGQITFFNSPNVLQFFESDSVYDDTGAYLDAQLAPQYVNQNVSFSIQFQDPSSSPPNQVLYTVSGSTSSGTIQADWQGLTCQDGSHFSGQTFNAVFLVTPPSGGPVQITKTLNKLATNEQGNNFDLVYVYMPKDNSLATSFGSGGDVWNGMLGAVNTLTMPNNAFDVYNSSFDHYYCYYCPPGQQPYPGYITSRTTISTTLFADMVNGVTKNFYCKAHGSGNWLGNKAGDVFMNSDEVGSLLGNIYKIKGGLRTKNPYRFVFLDGCSTASARNWRRAFGIFPLDSPNIAGRNKVGPQAYIGWADEHTGWMDGGSSAGTTADAAFAKGYTQTLNNFYTDWMSGKTLRECLDNASKSAPNTCPLPVPANKGSSEKFESGLRNSYHEA